MDEQCSLNIPYEPGKRLFLDSNVTSFKMCLIGETEEDKKLPVIPLLYSKNLKENDDFETALEMVAFLNRTSWRISRCSTKLLA